MFSLGGYLYWLKQPKNKKMEREKFLNKQYNIYSLSQELSFLPKQPPKKNKTKKREKFFKNK